MRRSAALALVAGGTLSGGTLAWYRLKGTPRAVSGIFPNGIAYARVGSGPKTMLFVLGGPGMGAPQGLRLALLPFWFYPPYIEAGYTVWIVARRQNMPKGHTIADMAEDYAGLIADELGGKADLVIGEGPTGGWIGFRLAARHPDRLGHLVAVSCGYKVSEQGKTIDYDVARLRVEGRWDDASALQFSSIYPDLRLPGVARVLGVAIGRLLLADSNPYRAHDGMVEAEAEMVFDAREILPQISVPVLLIGGDRDIYTPKQVYEETARLIPDCTLRLYEGQGIEAVSDKRLPRDVLDFVRQRSADPPERGAEQPTSVDQPARRRIHQDIWIAAPVEEVFALYCDATRWRELAGADMGEITSVSGPIDQVGTTFEGTMRIAGRKITGTGRIVEVEPLRLVRVRAAGPGAMGFVYRFEPEGNGTRFSADAEYEVTSALSKLVDKVVLHGYLDRAMRHMTAKMKEMAEAVIPVAT